MNNLAVLVFLAVTAFVAAYDFKDEIYNQIIKQDLDELDTSLFDTEKFVNVRRKREENLPSSTAESADASSTTASTDKCKKRRWRMCCGEEIVEAMIEKDKEIKKECFKEIISASRDEKAMNSYDPFSCEKINRTKKEWACVMQCVGQKKNIVDDDGNVIEKELLSLYKKETGNEEWFYSMIETALPKCLEQVKNGTEFVKDDKDALSCNPGSIKMHHCMWRELQLTCPDDKITDTKTCNKIREKIKKHDFLPFRHHAGPHDDE